LPLSLQGTRLAIKKNFNSLNLFFIGVIFPTMFAFFWVGLWHGAGWNYICFGLLNGFYIVVFNLWISVKKNFSNYKTKNVFLSNFFSRIFTFSLVTLSFVLFRAKDISSAEEILKAMIGLNGIQIFDIFRIGEFATNPLFGVIFIIFLLVVVFYFPNTQSFIFNRNKSIFNRANRLFSTTSSNKFCWKPTLLWGAVFGLIFLISIMFISNTNEFLYFEF